jgi:hypothetical protein
MSYDYDSYTTALATMLAVSETDPNFVEIEPSTIDYAEQRIYRELDLLSTIVRDSSATVTQNSRDFTLPQANGRFVTTQGINIYTPVNTTTARNPLVATTRDFIDLAWPSDTAASATTIPQYYAMITDQTVIFGPPPGDTFTAEVIGTIRPAPLSETNTTTFLTLYLPDLFFAASMIFMSGYQRNFGSQSDNPQMAQSWETQYQSLKSSADVEEMRKKYQSQAWTSMQPAPIATPPRS